MDEEGETGRRQQTPGVPSAPPFAHLVRVYRAVTLQTPLAPLKPHLELVEVQAAIVVRVPLAEHVPHPVLGEETVENGVTTR